MTAISYLAEWTLRSTILILSGALLLHAFRIKDASVRLATWAALLCGSLALPALTALAPPIALALPAAKPHVQNHYRIVDRQAQVFTISGEAAQVPAPFDWGRAAAVLYFATAGVFVLRIGAGSVVSHRLIRRSRATGRPAEGIEVRESDGVSAPVTLGILRPAIVLPAGWREWDESKLEAVLAHERSHVRRMDPAVQFLSSLHRAVLWHSPLSWFLHRRIVRVAEEASDDAAVAAVRDRAAYAGILLEFMRRPAASHGVAMARYGCPEKRIRRILDGTCLSRGVTLRTAAVILLLGAPLVYVAAAAHPQRLPQRAAAAAPIMDVAPMVQAAAPPQPAADAPKPPAPPPPAPAPQETTTSSGRIRSYMIAQGNDTTTGSWDSHDEVEFGSLRARFGPNFAWFQRDSDKYVITDGGVLAEIEKALQPQKGVNRMQSEVNAEQSKVNAMQSKVNSLQGNVNRLQHVVNRRQDIVNRMQAAVSGNSADALKEAEAALRELQKDAGVTQQSVNRAQSDVNAEQAKVNAEQHKVNEMQHKVNEAQHGVSAEFNRRIQEILESAIQRKLVQRLM
jgi:hypothetical protein